MNVNMSLDPTRGGTVERTIQMSKALVQAGAECIILTTDVGFGNTRTDDLEGLKIVVLPTLLERFYLPKWSYTIIRNLIKEVDVIHLMGHWLVINVVVYIFARLYKKPYIVCPAGELAIYGRSAYIKRLFNCVIGKRLVRDASGYVAIAVNELPRFNEYGIDSRNVCVIPNGISLSNFRYHNDLEFRTKYGIGDDPFILFVGRLNHIKGPDLLLNAYNNIKERKGYHLVFVGPDDGMLTKLKNMVAAFGIEDLVHFIGYLEGDDKSSAYYTADLLVIPSRQEAMSIVALEAGCTGTAVVITDQCGFDAIEYVGGGRKVPATVLGLQSGIEWFLENSDRLEIAGCKLKEFVYKEYLWSSVVNKYIDLYKDILEG